MVPPANSCGTFLALTYLMTDMVVGVPSGLKRRITSSLSISSRVCLTVFGGLYASSWEMNSI
jgi:hypothetical protein